MQKKLWVTLIVLFGITIVLSIRSQIPVFGFAERQIQGIFSTPKKDLYALAANTHDSQSVKVQQLENENRKLTEKLVDYQKLQKDNFALKSQLSDTPVSLSRLMEAHVVGFGKDSSNPDELVIDLGKNSGVKEDMIVVYGKSLVGIITKVLGNYAVVMLPTSKNFSVLGRTVQGGTLGIVKGNSDYIDFGQVVITDSLKTGDVVVTRGGVGTNGVGVLPDLVIGRAISVSRVASSSFQSAKLTSMLQFARLSTVFVILQ